MQGKFVWSLQTNNCPSNQTDNFLWRLQNNFALNWYFLNGDEREECIILLFSIDTKCFLWRPHEKSKEVYDAILLQSNFYMNDVLWIACCVNRNMKVISFKKNLQIFRKILDSRETYFDIILYSSENGIVVYAKNNILLKNAHPSSERQHSKDIMYVVWLIKTDNDQNDEIIYSIIGSKRT